MAGAASQRGHQRLLGYLMVVVTLALAAGAGTLAVLNRLEREYLSGTARHDALWAAVEAAEDYHASTGTMPPTTGTLLDWLDGDEARFAAGGQTQLVDQRRLVGATRIGTTTDGQWCVTVQQTRPPALAVLAGLPEQMTSMAVAGKYAGSDTDADPDECVAPDMRATS